MTKLSDTQLLILTAACQRPNQLSLPLPEHLRRSATQKVVSALLAKGLLTEVAAVRSDPVWREADDGQGVTLVATEATLNAFCIEPVNGPTGARTAATAAGESLTPPRCRSRPRATQGTEGRRPRGDEAGAAGRHAEASGGRDLAR